ncbi:MAG: hypothetical protein JXA07_06240 [Spirochaetes bacterium]|nr:hypothetical protein [Spirochaetota bacterium]
MATNEDRFFNEDLYVLKPGEYHATADNGILGTVTGSSVVVCLYDRERGIGGMCHFIVPGTIGTKGILFDDIARSGVTNMELLMGEIVKLGGDRRQLKAKVYGSGEVGVEDSRIGDILKGNLQFIEQYFKIEKIQIEEQDLGGTSRKKIFFEPKTGVVRKEEISPEDAALFVRLEKEYIDLVFKNKDKTGDVHMF